MLLAGADRNQQAANAECLSCHTTAYGRPGGFPTAATPDDHPDLSRVGCESCHGPGGNHVAVDALKRGSIVSLGDKCDSCVILQICGSCHDVTLPDGFRLEEAFSEYKLSPAAREGISRSATLATDRLMPAAIKPATWAISIIR